MQLSSCAHSPWRQMYSCSASLRSSYLALPHRCKGTYTPNTPRKILSLENSIRAVKVCPRNSFFKVWWISEVVNDWIKYRVYTCHRQHEQKNVKVTTPLSNPKERSPEWRHTYQARKKRLCPRGIIISGNKWVKYHSVLKQYPNAGDLQWSEEYFWKHFVKVNKMFEL